MLPAATSIELGTWILRTLEGTSRPNVFRNESRRKTNPLVADLGRFRNAQERFAELVMRARTLPPLDDSLRTEANRVSGCLARLWLVTEFRDGRCWFRCDSDSLVIRGIAALLCEFYRGATPEEIASHDPGFLRELGVTQHLTPNRRNGLSQVHRRIREFAGSCSVLRAP